MNGSKVGEFDSDAASVSTSLGIAHDGVHVVTLESIGIGQHEWISLLEVSRWRIRGWLWIRRVGRVGRAGAQCSGLV